MFIALTQRLEKNKNYNEMREILAQDWGLFFQKNLSNFLPLPLSFEIPFENYSNKIKAVILTGGNDLSIFNPSEENIVRDNYEKDLIQHSIHFKMPILAVCRGAQLLAYYFKSEIKKIENHVGNHFVKDIENRIFEVNSFHHYAITKLGKSLKPCAWAEDKTIEAFCHKALPFYAIMWHPERENGLNNTNILKTFLSEIKK